MKKKMIAMLLIAAITAGMAAGCGSGSEKKESADAGSTEAEETEATGEQETEVEAITAVTAWSSYDELIAQIRSTADPVQRETLMHEAEDMLMETGAILPLYQSADVYLQKENIEGIYDDRFGGRYFMYTKADKQELNIYEGGEPQSLDPAFDRSETGKVLLTNLFTGLFTYSAEGVAVPALCDSYEVSEDGLTYVFTLKDGLKWSDGSDLTAADFAYAWKRAADEATGGNTSALFAVFAREKNGQLSVAAGEDGKTLTAVLAAPCANLTELLALPAYVPLKQEAVEWEEYDEEKQSLWCSDAGFVTNGAYTVAEWNHGVSLVAKKNEFYYDAANVTMPKLNFLLKTDETAAYSLYRSGDLDFLDEITAREIPNQKNTAEFHVTDMLGTAGIAFNTEAAVFTARTETEAALMRRAMALLIDRDYIVNSAVQNGAKTANTFVPPDMTEEENTGYFAPSWSQENVDQAIEYLKEAGFSFTDDGVLSEKTPLSLTLLVKKGSAYFAAAQSIQQDFALVGITLEIKAVEEKKLITDSMAGKYQLALTEWIADYNSPLGLLEQLTTANAANICKLGTVEETDTQK